MPGASTHLKGRVAIVTGAGKGLGRAFALGLAAGGAAVVVNNRWTDRNTASSAETVVAEIIAAGGRAVANYDEAQDEQTGARLVAQAIETFGRLDIVIANAGVPESMAFRNHSLASFRDVFDINFFGALYLVQAAWPVLTGQSYGRIVINTSSAGLHANPGMPAYSSSKAALIGLGRSLALEGEKRNVRVNLLAPYAATSITVKHLDDEAHKPMAAALTAPLVTWLASNACDVNGRIFVTGLGKIASARAAESEVWRLEEDVRASVHASLDMRSARFFENATDAFNEFAKVGARAVEA
jgi:NAD(P)-dependent dehydrogenase (short-subunit alcohol dehydrogenase family)